MDNGKFMAKAAGVFSALILTFMILSAQTFAADMIDIKIYENAEIESDEIFLGEVGDVKGNDQGLVQKIKKIVIGRAPLPGKTKKIDSDHILIRLKQNGLVASQVNIIVPPNAVVTRRTVEIKSEDIEKIVLNFLDERLPFDKNKVKINDVQVNNKVILPKGDISYKVVIPKNTKLLGKLPLSVKFSVNGKFVKKVWVSVDIEVYTTVVVTKRPLGRYRLITENDIHLKEMNLAELSSSVMTRCEQVLGKRARRAIDSNVVLTPDLVDLPPLVKKGDIVLIIAESDGLRITTLGKVKEKGREGEMVRVENIDSQKGIYARVLDASSVKVDF